MTPAMNDRLSLAALNNSDLIEQGHGALARLHGHVFAADAAITALRLEIEGQPGMGHIVARIDDIEQHLAELPRHGEDAARACIGELGSRLLAARASVDAQEVAA